jgi:3-oxoacyl-[acyl-carrier protein] reductase
VTGASRGIGLGIAKVFADAGANVLICGRDKQAMRDALDSLHEATGEIDTAMVDVIDRLSCGDMAAYARKQFGGIDVPCANAGIFPSARWRI